MWNYRILKHVENGNQYYAIHEVFYENKKPDSCTEKPIPLTGFETTNELIESLEMIIEDCKRCEKDIIDYEYFTNK